MSGTKAQTIEIERKFLLSGDGWRSNAAGAPIRQGYLARTQAGIVRVRTVGTRGFLTVKSRTVGITRREFEYEIPREHAEAMFSLCEGTLIEKTRYCIEHEGHTWEVDVFAGANAGLVVAEIELVAEDEPFAKPAWIGDEVTADPRYGNASLSRRPYDPKTWGAR